MTIKRKRINQNERIQDITIDEVRELETFKDWNDDKIIHLIQVIKTFTEIAYHNFSRRKEFGKKIALHIDNQLNIAA